MTRFWGIAALVLAAMAAGFTQAGGEKDKDKEKDKDFFQVQGKFTKDDTRDQQRNGPAQVHAVKMKAGKVYTIDLVGTGFDSYLRLLDPKGNQLEEDDDSGGNLNARIIFNCTMDGEYKVVCTTFGADMYGAYNLTVKTSGTFQKPSTAHARMVRSSAPNFMVDFVTTGTTTKLSDLRGKVILLDFIDVRNPSCVAAIPQRNQWHLAYQKAGLVVIGVTFYPSDIDQALGFEEGKIVTVTKADRKSDRRLLSAFSSHHKLAFPLLALNKQEALDAYDAYAVNGLPQVVLIDRKGMVRMVDINGEKNSAAVEIEIKKVLAEK